MEVSRNVGCHRLLSLLHLTDGCDSKVNPSGTLSSFPPNWTFITGTVCMGIYFCVYLPHRYDAGAGVVGFL